MVDRPFPWPCGECGHNEVRPAIIDDYKIDVKHDGQMHEVHVENLEVPTCDNCGEQWFDLKTDDQITAALHKKIEQDKANE